DSGAPLQNAQVTFEATPRFIGIANTASGTARVASDVDGIAKTTMLPNIRALRPSTMIALTIEVAALDRDNDGVFELRGTTVRLMDLDVRNGDVPVIVLHAGAEAPIQIVASNLGTLVLQS